MLSEYVVIGRFGRTHGVSGQICVHSFADERANILAYSDWYIQRNGLFQRIQFLDEVDQVKSLLVRVEGFSSREAVATLTNVDIWIQRVCLPELSSDEYYWHELIGLKVFDLHGSLLGEVCEMLDTGANDVLVVQGDRRRLIPYVRGTVVLDINRQERTMRVDWDLDF